MRGRGGGGFSGGGGINSEEGPGLGVVAFVYPARSFVSSALLLSFSLLPSLLSSTFSSPRLSLPDSPETDPLALFVNSRSRAGEVGRPPGSLRDRTESMESLRLIGELGRRSLDFEFEA